MIRLRSPTGAVVTLPYPVTIEILAPNAQLAAVVVQATASSVQILTPGDKAFEDYVKVTAATATPADQVHHHSPPA